MHARTREPAAAALHDYPPVDKPDRLPLRQGWQTTAGERAGFEQASGAPGPAQEPRHRVLVEGPFHGQVRALNERALAQARTLVGAAHRQPVVFAEPAVHRYLDGHLQVEMEPLMFVRLNVPCGRYAAVVEELRRRKARLQEIELQNATAVVRAEAPLQQLLGLEQAMAVPGEPAVQAAIWLLRYEPVGGWESVARERVAGTADGRRS